MNQSPVHVRPLRFTNEMPAMRAFLEVLGLRPRVESEGGGWIDFVAGEGLVALHSAETSDTGGQPGETRLSFESGDLEGLASQLKTAGFDDATVWDESYGRVLSVTDPLGDRLRVDGYDGDDYGFRVHEPEPDERWRVMPVRFADPNGPVGELLAALGLPARAEGANEHWRVWGRDTGLVALHTPAADNGIIEGPAAVRLTFETSEPLHQVADRLSAAGHPAQVRPEPFGESVYVRDPDGQEVVVHHPPR